MPCFCSASKARVQGAPSMRRWIHDFWPGSWMCMNSTPTGPQYVSRRMPMISRTVAVSRPSTLSMNTGRSRSASVKP